MFWEQRGDVLISHTTKGEYLVRHRDGGWQLSERALFDWGWRHVGTYASMQDATGAAEQMA